MQAYLHERYAGSLSHVRTLISGLRLHERETIELNCFKPSSILMASTVDFRTHVDQSCRYSEEFVNIYYDCMDKKRRHLTRLYLDKATLVWNGNAVSGHDALGEFFESLPSSEFQVHTLDCQPVHDQATQGQTTLLVITGGSVKFDGNKQHYFNQNFLLTAQASPTSDQPVWKIASDCFRFQDWAS
ncbi:NTF2-related export protein 2 [Brienomyrus brachyistius]|uniref:NTF2-related export protein 2 n=1 Tax=Brienomyrus brachyistius TaxID=42636 RepID=UPI0020B39100|nr:NTF2-related export protein 2 [Brienomyrus brachyistius]